MTEIKYLKNLPCKQINNKCNIVALLGGDIYVDAFGGRYVFLGFRNNTLSPMYSLYVEIKQYDGSGTFIKATKFGFPNIYAPTGAYITQEPISVERECNGCEIYVSYADFGKKVFANDVYGFRSSLVGSPRYGVISQIPGVNSAMEELILKQEEETVEEPVQETEPVIEEPVVTQPREVADDFKPVETEEKVEETSVAETSTEPVEVLKEEAEEIAPAEEKPVEEIKTEEAKPVEEIALEEATEVVEEQKPAKPIVKDAKLVKFTSDKKYFAYIAAGVIALIVIFIFACIAGSTFAPIFKSNKIKNLFDIFKLL